MFDAEFWVAVAFFIFVGILGYFRVHKLVVKHLDERRDRIKAELDEARRLKEEAQALLAQYQRKQQEAEREAQAIVASAKAEAERLAAEAKTKMEDFVARRTKMAESKIAQAEAQALADVRAAAAEAAVAAAETILTRTVKGKVADDLIAQGHRRREAQAQLRLILLPFFARRPGVFAADFSPTVSRKLCTSAAGACADAVAAIARFLCLRREFDRPL